ncbi:terpenoid synthase [Polyplosphaeria fusca]|uniref:Terpenoid synthase n=1 Tax=Polyplosphaeria fusca TaxID=682080 RepID=A0A9P4R8F2_9PLEO|nr:terpenoid synthase [Polyplosphaeria fusca]
MLKTADSSTPAEYILHDLWEEMRHQDHVLADNILEPTFTFMRAQTDRARIGMQGLGKHLSYREKDVGKAYDKEYKVAKNNDTEGAALCSAVQVLSDESSIEIEGTKRVLWVMVREWEHAHERLVEQAKASSLSSQEVLYVKGLEYQMRGNEQWSRTTLRYHALD